MILISFKRIRMKLSLASMTNSLEDAAEVHLSPDLYKLLVPNWLGRLITTQEIFTVCFYRFPEMIHPAP